MRAVVLPTGPPIVTDCPVVVAKRESPSKPPPLIAVVEVPSAMLPVAAVMIDVPVRVILLVTPVEVKEVQEIWPPILQPLAAVLSVVATVRVPIGVATPTAVAKVTMPEPVLMLRF